MERQQENLGDNVIYIAEEARKRIVKAEEMLAEREPLFEKASRVYQEILDLTVNISNDLEKMLKLPSEYVDNDRFEALKVEIVKFNVLLRRQAEIVDMYAPDVDRLKATIAHLREKLSAYERYEEKEAA